MPSTAIYCGILLIAIGVAGYLYGVSTGAGSPTALIPAAFGVVLAILGFAAKKNEGPRRHLMHAAAVVALLGLVAVAGNLVRKGTVGASPADLSMIATAAVCLVYVLLSVRSFMSARVNRP